MEKLLAMQNELIALGKLAEFYNEKDKPEIIEKIKEIKKKL